MLTIQEHYERTYCDCQKCLAGCKSMPGTCAPGDVEAIAKECGVDVSDRPAYTAFVKAHFFASEGAIVECRGREHQVPAIVPAQADTGRCVFLGANDQCTVSRVAPFGCSRFRVCDGPEHQAENERKTNDLHHTIAHSDDYLATWAILHRAEKRAVPIQMRLQLLEELCDGI